MLHTGHSIWVPLTPQYLVAVLLKKLNEIWIFNIRHFYDFSNRDTTQFLRFQAQQAKQDLNENSKLFDGIFIGLGDPEKSFIFQILSNGLAELANGGFYATLARISIHSFSEPPNNALSPCKGSIHRL